MEYVLKQLPENNSDLQIFLGIQENQKKTGRGFMKTTLDSINMQSKIKTFRLIKENM